MGKYAFTLLLIIFALFIHWFNEPAYVQQNKCKIEDLVENPEDINKAILKMGPMYQYTISPDGTLKVNRGDGRWLTLKY